MDVDAGRDIKMTKKRLQVFVNHLEFVIYTNLLSPVFFIGCGSMIINILEAAENNNGSKRGS